MTAPRFVRLAALWTAGLIATGGVAMAASPMLRHFLVALLNDPRRLPALDNDARVHYEPAARACALEVAALLPAAVARIEAAQGRPFAAPPAIGVYASFENYRRANGLGDAGVAAVSLSGRLLLSPTLCGAERERLPAILAHELSHAHFFGWRSSPFAARPPSWFTEGLAVMVSEGGGAEGVDEIAAAAAILRGEAIVVSSEGLWRDFDSIRFAVEPPVEPAADKVTPRQRLAYRQAAMFVAWLHESDPKAFAALLRRIEDGDAFASAFRACFGDGPAEKWRDFVTALSR